MSAPKNKLQIDGKEIKGIQNVKIEYGIDNHIPVVTIQSQPMTAMDWPIFNFASKTDKVNIKGKKS